MQPLLLPSPPSPTFLVASIPGEAPKKSLSHLNVLPWKPNPQHSCAIDLVSSIEVSRFDSLSSHGSCAGGF